VEGHVVSPGTIAAITAAPQLHEHPLLLFLYATACTTYTYAPELTHTTMALAMRHNSLTKVTATRSVPIVRSSRRLVVRASAAAPLNAAATAVAVETASAVHVLNSDSYESFIASNEVVLVDYYTEWCGPCKVCVILRALPAFGF
jgi:thiol:disulfide interchange protein